MTPTNMRKSNDQYKIIDGIKTLWMGYNYELQFWVFEGKKDVRTLEEVQAIIN